MMILLIVCLVLWFVFPIAGIAVNVYILFKSRDLLTRTGAVFESRGFTLYASDIGDIRHRCEFILLSSYLKYSLYYSVAVIITLMGVALLSTIVKSDFGGGPLTLFVIILYVIMGLIGLGLFLVYFYTFYQSIYCLIRFFKVKGYVYRLATGGSLDRVPESSTTLALCACIGYWTIVLLFSVWFLYQLWLTVECVEDI